MEKIKRKLIRGFIPWLIRFKKFFIALVTSAFLIISSVPISANAIIIDNMIGNKLENACTVLMGLYKGIDLLSGGHLTDVASDTSSALYNVMENTHIPGTGNPKDGTLSATEFFFGDVNGLPYQDREYVGNLNDFLGMLPGADYIQSQYGSYATAFYNLANGSDTENNNQIGNVGNYFVYCNLDNVYFYMHNFFDTFEDLKNSYPRPVNQTIYYFDHLDGFTFTYQNYFEVVFLSESPTNFYTVNLDSQYNISSKTNYATINYTKDGKSIYYRTGFSSVNSTMERYRTFYYKNNSYRVNNYINYSVISANSSLIYRDYYNIPESGTGIIISPLYNNYYISDYTRNLISNDNFYNVVYQNDGGHYYSNYNFTYQNNFDSTHNKNSYDYSTDIKNAVFSGAVVNFPGACVKLGLDKDTEFNTKKLEDQMEILINLISDKLHDGTLTVPEVPKLFDNSPGVFYDTSTGDSVSNITYENVVNNNNYSFGLLGGLGGADGLLDLLKDVAEVALSDLYQTALKTFFPWCLAWDAYSLIDVLSADPVAPEIKIKNDFISGFDTTPKTPVDTDFIKNDGEYWTVTLSYLDTVAAVCRACMLVLFILGLCLGFKKFSISFGGSSD